MSSNDDFQDLIARFRERDDLASAQVVGEYFEKLVALASKRIPDIFRQKVDAREIVQSALANFFERDAAKPFDLQHWGNLWALLSTFVVRKCNKKIAHYLSESRDVNLEVSNQSDVRVILEALSREPPPDESLEMIELLEYVVSRFKDAQSRTIVKMILEGQPPETISEKTRVSVRTVYRKSEMVKQFLKDSAARDMAS